MNVDYIVITLYICLVFFIAWISGKEKREASTPEEQYLAGKKITFYESICSIIATEVSALTFLGIPAFCFTKDFSFVQIYFGAVIGRLIIARYFLPYLYDKSLTVYSIMIGKDGTSQAQKLITVFYAVSKILAVGVRLYSGSILVAQFLGFNIYNAILVVCFLTLIYTSIGGLKAVMRTDIIQMFLFISGGVAAHIIIPSVANQSWSALIETAFNAGKMNVFNPDQISLLFIGVFGGVVFDMATHGVDQDFAQRLMSTRTLKDGQNAIKYSSILSISVAFLFLSIGALLWSHYQTVPLPEGVKADELFAHFITNYFPSPLKGFMIAGVLAATMSTLDSTINALSSCLWSDLVPNRDPRKISFYAKVDTTIITFLLTVIAFIAANSSGMLLLGLRIVSYSAGSLLALFLVSTVFKKYFQLPLDSFNVFFSFSLGIGIVFLNTFYIQLPWQLNVPFGLCISLIFLLIYKKLSQGHRS